MQLHLSEILGWPKMFPLLFQKLIELYAKPKSMWKSPFRYMHFQCELRVRWGWRKWGKIGRKAKEKAEKRCLKMRSMNTYVCVARASEQQKHKSHCSYRDKRQWQKKEFLDTGPLPKMLFILSRAHECDGDRACKWDGTGTYVRCQEFAQKPRGENPGIRRTQKIISTYNIRDMMELSSDFFRNNCERIGVQKQNLHVAGD